MKIIYGKGECLIDYSQNFSRITIKYRGSVSLKHYHREIIKIDKTKIYIANRRKTSNLYNYNNQIDIFYKESPTGITELFKYNGTFKILSAKIDNKNIIVETKNIDYWNKINSTWNTAGKPEQYKGEYFIGKIPKKSKLSKLSKKLIKSRSNKTKGGY
tara:strand:+ start:222 stop:695 length:474 start_codon:yes stop_codon:yes gene_type:complete